MSWEKLPLLGALAALLLTAAFVRIVFIIPDFNFWFWDIFFYIVLFLLDIYLVGYKNSRFWKPFCYTVIVFSSAALLFMQLYPEESGKFLQPYLGFDF